MRRAWGGWGLLIIWLLLSVAEGHAALVGSWLLDENTGTTPQDSSGQGHHGVFAGVVDQPDWVAGHTGSGLSFPAATDAHVTVTNHADFTAASAFSFVGWAKATDATPAAAMQVISKNILDGAPQWNLFLRTNGTVRCQVQSNATVVNQTSTATMADNTWAFLACAWGSNVLHTYINAVEQGTGAATTGTMADNGQNVWLGNQPASGSNPWVGALDEIKVYTHQLSQAELNTLFGIGRVRHRVLQSRLPLTLWHVMRTLWRPAYAHH